MHKRYWPGWYHRRGWWSPDTSQGQIQGGDAFVFYAGNYESSAGNFQGKITSQEHTPIGRPIVAKVQHIGFLGTYSDEGAKVDAMALVGQQSIRYVATLRLLVAI